MKSAHLMAGARQGGAELFFERLIPALHQAGQDILPIIRRDHDRAARLAAAGTRPLQLTFGGRLDLMTRPRLFTALSRFAPRVAVAWMGRAARHAPTGPWVLVGRLGGTYPITQFKRCDHLIGNTPGMVSWIKDQGFPAARTHLLPNFAPDLSGAAPAALPAPQGAPKILAMGRLHRAKAFDVLLAALTRLPTAHAFIAGDGPERHPLATLARQAGIADRAHFLGWRTDTAALLAACDVLVCPSRQEPLGNVILEAFSAAKPVVASMAEGPSWLLEGGTRGILVPTDSAIALAAGIEGMLTNPDMAHRMAEAGRRHFEENFAEQAVIHAWRHFSATVEKP
jgi:glycosyltransferase involved in cell wall biosynthesis